MDNADSKIRLQEFFHAWNQRVEELPGFDILCVYSPPNAPEYTTVGVGFPVAPGPCAGVLLFIHPALEEGSVLFFSVTAIDADKDRIPGIPTFSFGSADEVVDCMLRLMALRYPNDSNNTENPRD